MGEPMATDSSLYCIRFATNHRSFALKKSCTIRSFSSFFAFQRFLLDRYPNALAQHLPPKHLLWVESSKTKVRASKVHVLPPILSTVNKSMFLTNVRPNSTFHRFHSRCFRREESSRFLR